MATPERVYTPFEAPYRMAMGIMALPERQWIEADAALADDLREKRRLLAERHGEVFAALPGSEAAQAEVLALLADHLARQFPEHYGRDGSRFVLQPLAESHDLEAPGMAPLDLAGRLVQEDLCVMQRRDEGWCLTAASVCFPTRWDLGAKIGRPLAAIHAPVPGFAESLAEPVHRFFDRMLAEKPVWRLNWSLLDDPALFQPGGHFRAGRRDDIDAGNAGSRVWLRVERQTLRRLPQSGAILFTIRIHRWPLSCLETRAEAAGRLQAALATMPAEMAAYKSVAVLGEVVRGYLDGIGAAGPGGTA